MNIGLDFDGVLVDLADYQLKYGTAYFSGQGKSVVNPCEYDIEQIFACSYKERQAFWSRYIWYYCLFYPPRQSVRETLKKLVDDGHTLYLITSRVYAMDKGFLGTVFRSMVRFWLYFYRIDLHPSRIIFCSEKGSAKEKAHACMKHRIDIMVDDKADNVAEISKHASVLCFDAPYNQEVQGPSITRVHSMEEVYTAIHSHMEATLRSGFRMQSASRLGALSSDEVDAYYKMYRSYYSALPFDQRAITKSERHYRVSVNALNLFTRLVHRPTILHAERIPEGNGLIFVSNHLGSCDQFPILTAIGNRPIHFLVKEKLAKTRRGIFYRFVGSVFVDDSSLSSLRDAMDSLTKILLHGGNVFIFPEGTRNKSGELLEFHIGAVRIAQATGAIIVPFGIEDCMNFRNRRSKVNVGEPFAVVKKDDLAEVNTYLRDMIQTLIDENVRNDAGDLPIMMHSHRQRTGAIYEIDDIDKQERSST